jgi:hypothetical protein
MKIRSITAFDRLDPNNPQENINELAGAIQAAQNMVVQAGYEVQSTRLASQPFTELCQHLQPDEILPMAQTIEASALQAEFGFISLGPIQVEDAKAMEQVASVLGETAASFLSIDLVDTNGVFEPAHFAACAEIIQQVSRLEKNGFANLKLAALANVAGGSPFFPAAYHDGNKPAFAFAPQAADLAVQAFESATNIEDGQQKLSSSIEEHSAVLEDIGARIEGKYGIRFLGIDFSMAPYPDERESLGRAIELMGVPKVGWQGSLTAAAVLTSAIQAADFKRTGFNGLLLPPLEDAMLAKRADEGVLSVRDLLLMSAVCGTGLDTIALAGDISKEALAAILMDLAALAYRLDKPLTARLMPIPGKQAGEKTDFEFEYFANSNVLASDSKGISGPMGSGDSFKILKR